jgi:hypothetical protein
MRRRLIEAFVKRVYSAHTGRNGEEARMISFILAVAAGVVFGRWLGHTQAQQPASIKVRTGDLRRNVHLRR